MVKATVDLANKVQHVQGATLAQAALVAEATVTGTNLVRILVLGSGEVAEAEEDEDGYPYDPRDDYDDWREDRIDR